MTTFGLSSGPSSGPALDSLQWRRAGVAESGLVNPWRAVFTHFYALLRTFTQSGDSRPACSGVRTRNNPEFLLPRVDKGDKSGDSWPFAGIPCAK